MAAARGPTCSSSASFFSASSFAVATSGISINSRHIDPGNASSKVVGVPTGGNPPSHEFPRGAGRLQGGGA